MIRASARDCFVFLRFVRLVQVFFRKEDLFMKLVGGAGGPELLATLQRNLPEFSPALIPRLAKGDKRVENTGS